MITIKINNKVKIQKYLNHGIRLFLKINDKWFCIKFNENETDLLYFVIRLFNKRSIR